MTFLFSYDIKFLYYFTDITYVWLSFKFIVNT